MTTQPKLVDLLKPSPAVFPPPQPIVQASTLQVSLKPAAVDLALYAGDDLGFMLTVINPDGSAADLTGMTAIAQIKRTHSQPIVVDFECSISGNVITLTMPNSESSILGSPSYIWDCRLQSANGTLRTVAAGSVSISAAVSDFAYVDIGP